HVHVVDDEPGAVLHAGEQRAAPQGRSRAHYHPAADEWPQHAHGHRGPVDHAREHGRTHGCLLPEADFRSVYIRRVGWWWMRAVTLATSHSARGRRPVTAAKHRGNTVPAPWRGCPWRSCQDMSSGSRPTAGPASARPG